MHEDESLLSEALDIAEHLTKTFSDQPEFTTLRDYVSDLQPTASD